MKNDEIDEAGVRRLQALFVMKKLSDPLHSEVLVSGRLAEVFKFATHRPANLVPGMSFAQDALLDVFREIAAGNAVTSLEDLTGKFVDVDVSLTADGTANILIDGQTFRFPYAGLLARDTEQRIQYLGDYLKRRTISDQLSTDLYKKVRAEALSNEEFIFFAGVLATSQESFQESLRAKKSGLTTEDLLPGDLRHWENLTAPLENSNTLDEFIGSELASNWCNRIISDPVRGLWTTSLGYCAPKLVPIDAFESVDRELVLNAVERILVAPDHFSLVGSFEICAKWVKRDKRFEEAGLRLLDKLLGDMNELKKKCALFAAAFTMVAPRLAINSRSRSQPAFWRRLAASSQASLIVRSYLVEDPEKSLVWAMENFGKAFVFFVLLEGRHEPRWLPDWLSPEYLVADAFGRVDMALKNLDEHERPALWSAQMDNARKWIVEQQLELQCSFPAIGESARLEQPSIEKLALKQVFEAFCDNPTFDALAHSGVAMFVEGVPKEVAEACRSVAHALQAKSPGWQDVETKISVKILSFAAVQVQDATLARTIAQFCISKFRDSPAEVDLLEIASVLIQCAAANADQVSATKELCRQFETLASFASLADLPSLLDSLRQLQQFDDGLATGLGVAISTARLGKAAA